MIIQIDTNDNNNLEQLLSLLKESNIKYRTFTNVYEAVCREEIEQALDSSNLLDDTTGSFYDLTEDKSEDKVQKLTNRLYLSNSANYAFQDLAVAAKKIADDKIQKILDNMKETIT